MKVLIMLNILTTRYNKYRRERILLREKTDENIIVQIFKENPKLKQELIAITIERKLSCQIRLQLANAVVNLQRKFRCKRKIKNTELYKEELLAVALHPDMIFKKNNSKIPRIYI